MPKSPEEQAKIDAEQAERERKLRVAQQKALATGLNNYAAQINARNQQKERLRQD